MTTEDLRICGHFTAAIALHYGPGPHPDGSPQQVHAGGSATVTGKPHRRRSPAGAVTRVDPSGQLRAVFVEPEEDAAAAERGRFAEAARAGRATRARPLGGGVTDSQLVDYEGDGQGVWKALREPTSDHDGHAEVAAYRLARLLGMDVVPPTVYSTQDGVPGTSQQFIPDLRIGAELDGSEKVDLDRFEDMMILDALTANGDRHGGNWGVDAAGRVWAIDHGHTRFRENAGRVIKIPRGDRTGWLNTPTAGTMGQPFGTYLAKQLWPQLQRTNSPARQAWQAHLIGEPGSSTPRAWRITPAKLQRLGRLRQEDIEQAIVPDASNSDYTTRTAWRKRAANVYKNIQFMLKTGGVITWW